MAKYGRGLNREIVGAFNKGQIKETFSVKDIKKFVSSRGWNIPETYLNICLSNGASTKHSPTYIKYFQSVGEGLFTVAKTYIGEQWV